MRVRVTGGPAGDAVSVRGRDLTVGPAETGELEMTPGAPFVYKDSFVYVIRLRSRRAAPEPGGTGRTLGSFVRIDLEVDRRPRN
jgi:hypothetical protein